VRQAVDLQEGKIVEKITEKSRIVKKMKKKWVGFGINGTII